MSIRQQVEDAVFLAQNGRYLGSLTILMLAVAASSRKCFPKRRRARGKAPKEMGDRHAFTLFLGGRIRRLFSGDYESPEFGTSGISIHFKGQQYEIEHILYEFYRCNLVHEGELPEDVEFVPPDNPQHPGLSISFSAGDKMVLDYGWVDLLVNAVVYARCNAAEFGINHFDLLPRPNVDENTFIASTVAKYAITPGRFRIFKDAVRLLSPETISAGEDEMLADRFGKMLRSGTINGGNITALSWYGLTDDEGRLQPQGLAILREVAGAYVLVEA